MEKPEATNTYSEQQWLTISKEAVKAKYSALALVALLNSRIESNFTLGDAFETRQVNKDRTYVDKLKDRILALEEVIAGRLHVTDDLYKRTCWLINDVRVIESELNVVAVRVEVQIQSLVSNAQQIAARLIEHQHLNTIERLAAVKPLLDEIQQILATISTAPEAFGPISSPNAMEELTITYEKALKLAKSLSYVADSQYVVVSGAFEKESMIYKKLIDFIKRASIFILSRTDGQDGVLTTVVPEAAHELTSEFVRIHNEWKNLEVK